MSRRHPVFRGRVAALGGDVNDLRSTIEFHDAMEALRRASSRSSTRVQHEHIPDNPHDMGQTPDQGLVIASCA